MAGDKDLKTEALVLRRTNYGETDRILLILTPAGKKSVLAKAVRKERSKLAGGIELFCLSEVVLHQGRGKLAVLTAAKMKEFYKNILADFESLEMASEMIKKIARAAEGADEPEHFKILKSCLAALNSSAASGGSEPIDSHRLAQKKTILTWFYFNLARTSGEQVNLYYDADGKKLEENQRYNWDSMDKALHPAVKGKIGADEIKMMRLMLTADLGLVLRVENTEEMMPELLFIAKSLNQV